MTEQAAEEAGVLRRRLGGLLTKLLELLAGFGELLLRLLEGIALDDDGLGKDIDRVGVATEVLLEHLLGGRVFLGELGLVDSVNQALNHLLFLRGHGRSLSGSAACLGNNLLKKDTQTGGRGCMVRSWSALPSSTEVDARRLRACGDGGRSPLCCGVLEWSAAGSGRTRAGIRCGMAGGLQVCRRSHLVPGACNLR